MPDDFVAYLDDGEIQFDLGFGGFSLEIVAYDIRKYLACAVK